MFKTALCSSTWGRSSADLRPSGVFQSFKPEDTLRAADQQWSYDYYPSLDSFQFSWSLFNHSQLDVLSTACPSAFTAALRCLPTMPRELNVVHTECAGKPRQPTSTGNSQVCHPRSLRVCRSVYLAFSIHMTVLWHLSSQGTVSSTMTICTICLFFYVVNHF